MMKSKDDGPTIEAIGLKTHFQTRVSLLSALLGQAGAAVRAVDGVDLAVRPHSVLGLVGESGCGKSTLGMTLVRMHEPTGGTIRYEGEDVTHISGRSLKSLRRQVQIIFQDPYSSINPRLTVGQIVEEPLHIHRIGDRKERVDLVNWALAQVRMPPEEYLDRFPSDLSGGQRQRVAIARALVMKPSFIVADEPVSMLDVSIQAGVLEILSDLSERLGLAVLYISHDIATVGYICEEVAVMYAGQIVEKGPARQILTDPKHPYSQRLIEAIPRVEGSARRRVELSGEVPSPLNVPTGCRFAERCAFAMELCSSTPPDLRNVSPERQVRCFLYSDPGATDDDAAELRYHR